MTFLCRTRRLATWITCIAILFATLAPSISHALVSAGKLNPFWTEICSAQGTKFIKSAGLDGISQEKSSSSGFEHCLYCTLHGGSLGLPPVSGMALPVLTGSFPLPSLFYQAPRPLFIWARAQSRAPPAFV